MKRSLVIRKVVVGCLVSVALAAARVRSATCAEGTPQWSVLAMPSPVTAEWQVGDRWAWTVEAYEKFGIPQPDRYLEGAEWRRIGTVRAEVAALEEGAEGPKWRLEFTPGEDMPNFASERFTVWIYRDSGKIAGVGEYYVSKVEIQVAPFDGMALAHYGGPFPEVFMPVSTAPIVAVNPRIGYPGTGGLRLEVRRDQVLDITVSTVGSKVPNKRIRQVWPAGAKWWTECEWWEGDGHGRARLITPEAAATAPPPVEDEAAARAHEAALRSELNTILQIASTLGSGLKADEAATAIRLQLDAALQAARIAAERARQKQPWRKDLEAARAADRAAEPPAGSPASAQARPAPSAGGVKR